MSEISAFSVYKQLKKKKTSKSKTTGIVKRKVKLTVNSEEGKPINLVKIRHTTPSSSVSIVQLPNCLEFYDKPGKVFRTIIYPVEPQVFFTKNWENTPLVIKRNSKNYYRNVLTTEKLDDILHKNCLFYTRNVDVVSYINGKKETHNPEGRAVPAALWDYYQNGCSIRILNPHSYCPKLHSLITSLQEYFGSMVGINAYLTPPNSQGFAPHYDDIEAFVIQLEGRKHWKLYAPLKDSDILPRNSSKNFDRSELNQPIKAVTLEAGDFLYFPRGTIHEGFTDANAHSFHVTISVYQKTSYIDLLENILGPALQKASTEDVDFRRGLPLQYLQHLGAVNSETSSEIRTEVKNTVKDLFTRLLNYIEVDAGVDQLGKRLMWDSMPPVPLPSEKLHMVHENSERIVNGQIINNVEINVNVEVRLFRYHCLRVVTDEENAAVARIYYNTENAKVYHEEEQQFLTIDVELLPAVECLIYNYPEFVAVKSLPLHDDASKMQIVSDLWEKGLLVTQGPLTCST